MAGTRFGRYRLEERLGAGGMAEVFRAVIDGPEGFSRSMVIKRVRRDLSRNPEFARMLVSEARVCALLHHPTIVQVLELGKVDDEYFLAMEYIEGIDLRSVLRRCRERRMRPPIGVVCHIISEIAAALSYAHALSDATGRPLEIIHRDISPSNIMVMPSGSLKLLDFGIAKAAEHVRDETTRTGAIKGKLSYLSPEQADGLPIDRRADLFALGIVLWETLLVERLFRGKTDLETLRLVREARIIPPSRRRDDVPPELDAVVMRMLSRDPADRFAYGDDVVGALAPLIHQHLGDAGALRRLLAELGPIVHEDTDAALGSTPPPPTPTLEPVPPASLVPDVEQPTKTTMSGTAGDLSAPGSLQPRERPWPTRIVATLAVAVAVALVVVLWTSRPPANTATVATVPTVPTVPTPAETTPLVAAPPPAPAAPATVQLRIEGPAGDQVSIDGKAAGSLPLRLELPRQKGSRSVVVRGPRHPAVTRVIASDQDVLVEIAAAPTTPPPPAAKPPARRRRAHATDDTPDLHDPFGRR